MFKVYTMA